MSKFAAEQHVHVSDDEVVQEFNNFLIAIGQADRIGDERFTLDSPLAQNFRNTILGRKTLARLEQFARGEAALEPDAAPEAAPTVEEPAAQEEDAAQA